MTLAVLHGIIIYMTRDDILSVLTAHRVELEQLGVQRAALFGSMARGTATAASDIDILLDLKAHSGIGVYEYVGIVQFLQSLFNQRVDVANHAGLKPGLRPRIEREAVYAF